MPTREEFMQALDAKCAELRAEREKSWEAWETAHPVVQSTQVLALAEVLYDLGESELTEEAPAEEAPPYPLVGAEVSL